jgi:hypothetical protein
MKCLKWICIDRILFTFLDDKEVTVVPAGIFGRHTVEI